MFIDNSEVQCREFPIVEWDATGNSYQHRQLRDGSMHRVLKNFPNQAELERMLDGVGGKKYSIASLKTSGCLSMRSRTAHSS